MSLAVITGIQYRLRPEDVPLYDSIDDENRRAVQSLRRTVVLLKHGVLEAVECQNDEIFLLARVRGAGICGVFDDVETAHSYIQKHALPSTTVFCGVSGSSAVDLKPI